MAEPIKFIPKDRQGDPDFPGIPELARFYKPREMYVLTGAPTVEFATVQDLESWAPPEDSGRADLKDEPK